MQIGKYLKETQPIIYQTFVNAFKSHTLSHAYLLVGNPGTPLFDVAKSLNVRPETITSQNEVAEIFEQGEKIYIYSPVNLLN